MHGISRVMAVAALVAAVGCGGGSPMAPAGNGNTGGNNGGNNGGNGGSTSNSIAIGDNFFNPGATTVAVGTTVTWTWSTGTTHNVTFGDGTSSGDRSSGSYTRTFNSAGTFSYQCTIHAGMAGTITVM